MVLRNLHHVPFEIPKLFSYAKHPEKHSLEERYALIQKIDGYANKGGRVRIEAHGVENIPREDGFIFYPNHQGMYDVLSIIQTCPRPFSVVMKKELSNIFFLKQIFALLESIPIDREDIRQSMEVIKETAERVRQGKNFLIFAEGTRSKDGNHPHEFKGGSFKSAVKARCPIVPVALVDAFKPFDTNSLAPVTVKVCYLKPLYFEEYSAMKTSEIAEEVKRRIEAEIRVLTES